MSENISVNIKHKQSGHDRRTERNQGLNFVGHKWSGLMEQIWGFIYVT